MMIKKLYCVVLFFFFTGVSYPMGFCEIDTNEPFKKIAHSATAGRIPHGYPSIIALSNNNAILLFGLTANILCSALLFYTMTLRHKKAKLYEAYVTEARISKKLHDEIANEIYGTMLYIANERAIVGESKELLALRLDTIYSSIRNISRENSQLDTGDAFSLQLRLMVNSYNSSRVNIITKGFDTINWDTIDESKKIVAYRGIQEYLVNMHKHSGASVVLLDFSIKQGKLHIAYSDNGIGMAKNKELSKNGLHNINYRAKELGGSLTINNTTGKGFKCTLVFPV